MSNGIATFEPTVWENYLQVKSLVTGKGLKRADIADPYLKLTRDCNSDISNLMSLKVQGATQGTQGAWINRTLSKSIALVCERREALAKMYLDSIVPKKKSK